MKNICILLLLLSNLILFSCAPVLSKSYLKEGEHEVSFNALRTNPVQYKGKLYVFGGVIVQTRLTEEGSQIEAMQVPVDRYGYFKEHGRSEGRFLAIIPKEGSMLDPEVFQARRRVTFAGEFQGVRKARIDEMDYVYPVFVIKQIYLWPKERTYYPAQYYDPWFYPYPYYYWDPWWRYPYYPYYHGGPFYGIPPVTQPSPSQGPSQFRRFQRAPDPGPGPAIDSAPERGPERGLDRAPQPRPQRER